MSNCNKKNFLSKNNPETHSESEEDDDDDESEDEDYIPKNENNDEIPSEESESGDEEDFPLKSSISKKDKNNDENDDDNDKQQASNGLVDKERIDKLWEEFHETASKACGSKSTTNDDPGNNSEKVTVTKEYDFAGETVLVKETVMKKQTDDQKEDNKNNDTTASIKSSQFNSSKRPLKSGVASLLSQLKKPKISTLKKSLMDWNEFKESENIEEELDQNRRSKGSFLQRQAFLSRTDLREFENEKSVRDHARKIRDLKQNK